MNKQPEIERLLQDYENLLQKYEGILKAQEFAFSMLQFATKTLMDLAPRHKVALKTIALATEEGIRWHVEEKQKKN